MFDFAGSATRSCSACLDPSFVTADFLAAEKSAIELVAIPGDLHFVAAANFVGDFAVAAVGIAVAAAGTAVAVLGRAS